MTEAGNAARSSGHSRRCRLRDRPQHELFLIEKFIVPRRGSIQCAVVGLCPLYLRKRTNSRRLGHVGFVPILLQKSPKRKAAVGAELSLACHSPVRAVAGTTLPIPTRLGVT
jgi:hypothetical protein